VRTIVEVVAGERFARVTVELDNPSRDHRLRLHVPLPARVGGSDAESAFAVVHSPLEADGNPMEAALATSPSHRFVDCSDGVVGVAVVHDGTGEHEVVADGCELAFTLFRSVGQLSRDDGTSRPNATGPPVALPEAQLLGRIRRRMAVAPHRGGWEDIDLPAMADQLLLPLDAAYVTTSTRVRPAAGGRLDVRGAEISAVVRHDGALEVRAVRLSSTHGEVAVDLDGSPARGSVVDLHGTPRRPFDGTLGLRPWEVVTIRVDEP
jgi:alpha-mannosidase